MSYDWDAHTLSYTHRRETALWLDRFAETVDRGKLDRLAQLPSKARKRL